MHQLFKVVYKSIQLTYKYSNPAEEPIHTMCCQLCHILTCFIWFQTHWSLILDHLVLKVVILKVQNKNRIRLLIFPQKGSLSLLFYYSISSIFLTHKIPMENNLPYFLWRINYFPVVVQTYIRISLHKWEVTSSGICSELSSHTVNYVQYNYDILLRLT